jgi:phenylacetate-CoA ligase
VRYRTRDLTALVPEPCPCGRTTVRMRRLEKRTDDMVIIRGVTVHPTSVEAVLKDIPGAEQHQIVIEKVGALDKATVLVEVSESIFFDEMKKQSEFREHVRRRLVSELGVNFEVRLVGRKTRESLAGKGRVLDLRRGGNEEGRS